MLMMLTYSDRKTAFSYVAECPAYLSRLLCFLSFLHIIITQPLQWMS